MAVPKTWTTTEKLTAADLNASLASTAWTAVTFTNSWVNDAAPMNACQYRKVGDEVELRGRMKSGTINTAAFTLPSGFRPPATLTWATESNNAYGTIQVDSAGVVTPVAGSNVAFSITVVRFSVTS